MDGYFFVRIFNYLLFQFFPSHCAPHLVTDFHSNSSADLRKEQPVSYANHSSGPTQVYQWELVNDSVVTVNAATWHRPPPLCTDTELRAALHARTGGSQNPHNPSDFSSLAGYCRTESYQAIKIAWAMLGTSSPQLAQLASKMHLSNHEFNALVTEVRPSFK